MKFRNLTATGAAILALALPMSALAQSGGPAPNPPGPNGAPTASGTVPYHRPSEADIAHMRHVRDEMARVHAQERAMILAALTPSHRRLLADIVGSLAIASSPDVKAAAARLDGALSASESKAITDAASAAHAKMRELMQGSMMERGERPGGDKGTWSHHEHTPPTAGAILLHTALGALAPPMRDHGPMDRMPMGHGPMGPGPADHT